MKRCRFSAGNTRLLYVVGWLAVVVSPWTAAAQEPILQNGDIVIGGARVIDSFGNAVGRIYRYRDGVVDTVFDGGTTPGLGPIGRLFIDSEARIVFSTYYCGGNFNSSALWRVDLATGIAEQLACFPYIASPGNIPPGLPPDASNFYLLASLYPTKALRITIDDDVNGGRPQVGYDEAYGCTIGVTIDNQTRPMAFRYLPDQSRFENDVPLGLLSPAGGPPQVIVEDSYTYYANGHGQIGRAQPSIVVDVSFDGDWGSFSGKLEVRGRNELLMSGEVLDNTLIPNFSVKCGDIEDDNVPELGFWVLSGIMNLGFVNGGIFVTSNSVSAGRPYLFNLAPRGPFLNPYVCRFYAANQYDGPIEFFEGKEMDVAIGDGGRVLGTQRGAGKLVSVQPDGSFQLLASDLVSPVGVAVYPPKGDVQTGRNLTLRIDEPVGHVLLTDPDGRQLGHAPDGSEVNDFDDRGVILNLGQPQIPIRVYTVSDPAAGNWQVQMAGTDLGPYTLRGYLADVSEGGTVATADGDAQAGVVDYFDLVVTPPLGLLLRLELWPDADGDGDVDSVDFAGFQRCFSGADGGPLTADICRRFDHDHDDDVDPADFAALANCGTGPAIPLDAGNPPPDCSP